jgi:hypothetical protein
MAAGAREVEKRRGQRAEGSPAYRFSRSNRRKRKIKRKKDSILEPAGCTEAAAPERRVRNCAP